MEEDLTQEIKKELYESIRTLPPYSPTKNTTSTITDMMKLIITIGSALFSIFGAFFTVKMEVASLENKVQNNYEHIREIKGKLDDVVIFRYNSQKDLEYQNLSINELETRIEQLEQEIHKIKRALDKKQGE